MLTIRRNKDLGSMQNSWLNARYHFSFADYHNPQHMGLGNLRVINDDIIAAGGGFGMHGHNNMEIITYVRAGAVSHRDNLGNEGVIRSGEVQVMSAGTGIVHSEFNAGEEPANLYQIWVIPNKQGVQPRWEQRAFGDDAQQKGLRVLASGRDEDIVKGALLIYADAAIYGATLQEGEAITQKLHKNAYLLISSGSVKLGADVLHKGDGVVIENEQEISFAAQGAQAEVLVIDLSGK